MNETLNVATQVIPGFDLIGTMMWLVCILIALGVFAGIAWFIFQMFD